MHHISPLSNATEHFWQRVHVEQGARNRSLTVPSKQYQRCRCIGRQESSHAPLTHLLSTYNVSALAARGFGGEEMTSVLLMMLHCSVSKAPPRELLSVVERSDCSLSGPWPPSISNREQQLTTGLVAMKVALCPSRKCNAARRLALPVMLTQASSCVGHTAPGSHSGIRG